MSRYSAVSIDLTVAYPDRIGLGAVRTAASHLVSAQRSILEILAEREGFEPSVPQGDT